MTLIPESTTSQIAVSEEGVSCPLCDYDLRGLPQPRCPECGFESVSWEVLREQVRTTHPYLFEHQSRRGTRAFVRTAAEGLRPVRFWTSVRPYHAIRPRRLLLYWMICSAIVLVPCVMSFAQGWIELSSQMSSLRARQTRFYQSPAMAAERQRLVQQFGSLDRAMDYWVPAPPSWRFFANLVRYNIAITLLLAIAFAAIVWPWVIVLSLRLFRTTLRQARIRTWQLIRCAIYSADAVIWLVPLLLAMFAWTVNHPMPWRGMGASYDWRQLASWYVIGIFAFLVLTAVRLAIALRRYLQLRHAAATAVLVQLIAGLLLWKLVMVASGY